MVHMTQLIIDTFIQWVNLMILLQYSVWMCII